MPSLNCSLYKNLSCVQAMTVCQNHVDQRPGRREQDCSEACTTPTCSKGNEGASDVTKRKHQSIDDFHVVPVTSASKVPPWPGSAPPLGHFHRLPRPFSLSRSLVDKRICWTENHDKAPLEFQALSTVYGYGVHMVQKAEHVRPLRYRETTSSSDDVGQRDGKTACELRAVAGNDDEDDDYDDAYHRQLRQQCPATIGRSSPERHELDHYRLIVTTYASVLKSKSMWVE